MVTKDTKLKDLYKGTPLEEYAKVFYRGFFNDYFLNKGIGTHNDGLWRNEETVKSLNDFEKLFYSNKTELIHLNKQKPNVSLIVIKQEKESDFALFAAGGCFTSVATAIETLPMAVSLYNKGYSVGILIYSILEEAKFNSSVEDMASAIKYLLDNQTRLQINLNNYMLIGCSAGGNVVARFARKDIGYQSFNLPKPKLIGLAYPVITFGKYAHSVSKITVLGENPSQDLIDLYSTENHIDNDYPCVYMWQCLKDNQVPIQNTIMMDEALTKKNVPHIYKTFDSDAHGWGIGTGTLADGWLDDMLEFYKTIKS